MHAQVGNPIAAPVVKRGLSVQIKDVARLPDTRGRYPADQDAAGWARVSYVRDLPDGRRFANDSRGLLCLLDRANRPSPYADVAAAFSRGFFGSLQSGFIGFEFHPEFAQKRVILYSARRMGAGQPRYPALHSAGVRTGRSHLSQRHHGMARNQPGGERVRRYATRVAPRRTCRRILQTPHRPRRIQTPTSKPGASDYGLLYTSGSDFGFSNGGGPHASNPGQTQRLDTLVGAILRVDPRSPSESGGIKGVGDYTIPSMNKFAADGDPKTLGEIYAYGFRNAHRLSWDLLDGDDVGVGHRHGPDRGDQHRSRRP